MSCKEFFDEQYIIEKVDTHNFDFYLKRIKV